jgi:hypothetical protein
MPRKERGERVPRAIAWRGFNNNRPQPPTSEVDIVHIAPQVFALGLLTDDDLVKLATRLNALLKGKTFTVEGRTWNVVKVFSAGEGRIRMRCQEVSSDTRETNEQ